MGRKYRFFIAMHMPPGRGLGKSECGRQKGGQTVPLLCIFHLAKWARPAHHSLKKIQGLPWWPRYSESACQCRGHRLDPWSAKIPRASGQLSPCTTTTEAHVPQSLCSATREDTARRSPLTETKSSPRSLQLEKACSQQRRPGTANN